MHVIFYSKLVLNIIKSSKKSLAMTFYQQDEDDFDEFNIFPDFEEMGIELEADEEEDVDEISDTTEKPLKKPKFKYLRRFSVNLTELAKQGTIDYISSKLLMNCLYGKFGQRRERESIVIFPKSKIGLTPIDFFEKLPVYVEKIESEAKHILPAIASFVQVTPEWNFITKLNLQLRKKER